MFWISPNVAHAVVGWSGLYLRLEDESPGNFRKFYYWETILLFCSLVHDSVLAAPSLDVGPVLNLLLCLMIETNATSYESSNNETLLRIQPRRISFAVTAHQKSSWSVSRLQLFDFRKKWHKNDAYRRPVQVRHTAGCWRWITMWRGRHDRLQQHRRRSGKHFDIISNAPLGPVCVRACVCVCVNSCV